MSKIITITEGGTKSQHKEYKDTPKPKYKVPSRKPFRKNK